MEVCKTCCLDFSVPDIVFTDTGCNYCDQARKSLREIALEKNNLPKHYKNIHGKTYDCLIGLSGGVDSSYVLHLAVGLGLRPLCFSVDTGYNKPDADENIMNLVEGLKVPFYRYTIDLKAFKSLQSAFLKAGVKNAEIPTDHVLMAVSLELAAKYGIKYIVSGGNVATESIMPSAWGHNARDLTHIKDIYKKMTGKNLKGLPTCSLLKWNWYRWIRGIKTFYLLDYFNYNRAEAEQVLINKYNFKSTGDKHEENYFTWWFQNWYLFEKWGIDKRKAHYASMVVSGQMSRADALEKLLTNPIYPEFGIEKKVLTYPKHRHEDYKIDPWYNRIANFLRK